MAKFRSAYDLGDNKIYFSKNDKPSLTKQSFKEECDINTIVDKIARGETVPLTKQDPLYGDFSDVPSYRASLERVMRAEAQFMAIPAKIRAEFDNDPAQFLAFARDPKNAEQMVAWGLLERKDAPQPSQRPDLPPKAASQAPVEPAGGSPATT